MTRPDLAATITALAAVSMPPGTRAKAFAREVQSIPIARLSVKQIEYVYTLAWRFRRQIPEALWPDPPLPKSVRKAPAGPIRIFVRCEAECPEGAVWCGAGSPWANPWLSTEPQVRRCVRLAYISAFNPPMAQLRGLMARHKEPTPAEENETRRWLYCAWLNSRLANLPKHIRTEIGAAMQPDRQGVIAIPLAPRSDGIRAALAGKPLADSTRGGWWSHVDELLQIARLRSPS